MENWAKWLTEFEEALEAEKEMENPRDEVIRLLQRNIDECKENLE